jgi:hypothetical protein
MIAAGAPLVACGDDDDSEPGGTAGTATTAADPEVAALFGTWRTTISEGDNVTLRLRDGGYSIARGPAGGTGQMKVADGEAEFFGSNLCDGTGVYRWSIQDEALTFVSVDPDECPGRSEVLDGKTYRK